MAILRVTAHRLEILLILALAQVLTTPKPGQGWWLPLMTGYQVLLLVWQLAVYWRWRRRWTDSAIARLHADMENIPVIDTDQDIRRGKA